MFIIQPHQRINDSLELAKLTLMFYDKQRLVALSGLRAKFYCRQFIMLRAVLLCTTFLCSQVSGRRNGRSLPTNLLQSETTESIPRQHAEKNYKNYLNCKYRFKNCLGFIILTVLLQMGCSLLHSRHPLHHCSFSNMFSHVNSYFPSALVATSDRLSLCSAAKLKSMNTILGTWFEDTESCFCSLNKNKIIK
jgi:hypothetical protein